MLPNPAKPEIDHRTMKLLVGLIALTLGNLTTLFSGAKLASISESYWHGGWAQSVFVGFLFAISAFLFAYNGLSRGEMLWSKLAAVAALGVALYPCGCDGHPEAIPYVHFGSAAVMFAVLAYFCWVFYKRARGKGHLEANRRAVLYFICGAVISLSILTLLFDFLAGGMLTALIPRLLFYCERSGLVAFGISWLTASRIIPLLARSDERLSLFD